LSFSEIKGQAPAMELLMANLRTHRAHSYLFCGPEGVGKKKSALATAQYLNCPHHTDDACGLCPSCRKIAQNEHPDVILIEPDGNSIKIEQVRPLSKLTALKSYEGGYQVVIINDAHLLTEQAANSLLKILEEPKDNTVFILITSKPESILTTIRSRCITIKFQALSPAAIVEILGPQAENAAFLAAGSAKTAADIMQDAEFFSLRQDVFLFNEQLMRLSKNEIIDKCAAWQPNKAKATRILAFLQLWYRDLYVYRLSQNPELMLNKDCIEQYKSARIFADFSAVLELLEQHMRYLRQNTNPELTLEVCFFKLSALLNK